VTRRRGSGNRPKPMLGIYMGWNGSSNIDAFETANNVQIPLGHEFGDQTQWSFFSNGTNFTAWDAWVAARAGRRFSYSCPLLTATDSGNNATSPTAAQLATRHANLASGIYDTHFTSLGNAFQAKANLRNAIVRLGWEFNGNSRAWSVPPNDQTTLDNYKAGFTRACAALKAACPTLKIEWCPNTQLDYTQRTFDDMYPTAADSYIDYIGIGLYDYYWPGGTPTHTTVWNWLKNGQTGVNGLANQVSLARTKNKGLGHIEWGLWKVNATGTTGEGDSPAFMRDLYDWYEQNGYLYTVYNNVDAEGDHKLDYYPQSKAVYLYRYGGVQGGLGRVPLGTAPLGL
jgi:hypothetical protein